MAARQAFASDYIDVATRIVEFRDRFPDGSLQQVSLDFKEVGGTAWVIYTAAAYRTPEDPRPGHGTAWEPVPGWTPFTKGSEVQNAETAAWGRAIVAALAGDAKKGIASAEEVRNAQDRRAAEEKRTEAEPRTPLQLLLDEIRSLAGSRDAQLAIAADWADTHNGESINQTSDLGALELLRDDLRARAS